MRLALHACCGPCLLEPYDLLSKDAEKTTVVYFNPNIHPREEYEKRRDTLSAYAEASGIDVVELEYDPAVWERTAGSVTGDKASRCRACYRLRLGRVAEWAAANGYDAISTTLTVSPYQDAQGITEEGRAAAAEAGVEYLVTDFRDRYPDATRRSRELGMYRQNFCGCRASKAEAEEERAARRAAKARGSLPG
jgi:predicted adenine nucleotide alpha hydrolase (AANH) superfamily ATPase